jgi:hypothetical protein
MELNYELKKKHINISVITESKKTKLKGSKYLEAYTSMYSGVDQSIRARCGVALMVDQNGYTELSTMFI